MGKRPLQSEPSPSKRDTPAPLNEEETAKPGAYLYFTTCVLVPHLTTKPYCATSY